MKKKVLISVWPDISVLQNGDIAGHSTGFCSSLPLGIALGRLSRGGGGCAVKNESHQFAHLPKLRGAVSTNLDLFSGSFWSVGIAPHLEEKNTPIIMFPF